MPQYCFQSMGMDGMFLVVGHCPPESPTDPGGVVGSFRNREFLVYIQIPPSFLSCSWASVNGAQEWVAASSEFASSASRDKGRPRSSPFCMGCP